MVVSKNNPDNYKTLKVSIGTVIKDSEMLRFVPDHLKTKKICKNAVKKLPFLMKYVSDRYKTKEICDKVIIHNFGMVGFIPAVARIKKCVIKLLIIMH